MKERMPQILQLYAREILPVRLDRTLSDAALAALCDIHVSLQNRSVVHEDPAEKQYDRRHFNACMGTLYGLCRRRCDGSQSLARRSRMLPVLDLLLRMPMRPADFSRTERCQKYLCRTVDEWMEGKAAEGQEGNGRKEKGKGTSEDWRTEHDVLRCILALFSCVAEEERCSHEYFRRLCTRLTEWATAMTQEGAWRDIPDAEALSRLDLLNEYSTRYADAAHDCCIRRGRACYCRKYQQVQQTRQTHAAHTASPTEEDCRALHTLYRLFAWSADLPDTAVTDALAAQAARWADGFPHSSAARLQCLAVVIDRCCMRQNEEMFNQAI